MLKIVALSLIAVTILSSNETDVETLKGESVDNVNATYVDYGKEWDLKNFKHDPFAEYMPKKDVIEIVDEYAVQEEVIEYEEEYVEDEVYLEPVVYEVIEEEIYEEVFEEPVQEIVEEVSYSSGVSFEATAYAVGDGLTPNTYTRNGTDVSNTIYTPDGYRIIAVDMNVIPLNSIVRVTYSDGTTFLAMACDTGSAIVGNKIDVLYSSPSEALSFGRQNVTVEFIN